MNELVIYTDGAYSPLRDQGGIGIVFTKEGKEIMHYSKMYKQTTNNQMELIAVILAMKAIKKKFDKVTIISDSQYVLGCLTKGWKRKKNQDLWAKCDIVYKQALELNPNITFKWTKGHDNDEFNNKADNLAVLASHET